MLGARYYPYNARHHPCVGPLLHRRSDMSGLSEGVWASDGDKAGGAGDATCSARALDGLESDKWYPAR